MRDQPITLGELTALLAARPATDKLQFDFASFVPTSVDSYRGYYDHLAIGYADAGSDGSAELPTVADILAQLRAANGTIFEGYKGGDFRMHDGTPMWVANYGKSGYTAIVGVQGNDYGYSRILTAYCEDWAGGGDRAMQVLFGGLGYGNV